MKVLQIGATYKDGGPGYTAAFVHKALIIDGEDSKVFHACGQSYNDLRVRTYEKKHETILRKFVNKLIRNLHFIATTQTIRLIKMIKDYNPDIIHLRVIHHGYTNYIMLFKFLSKYNKPVIITLHDMWIVTGGCYHYHNVGCKKFQRDCSNCPKDNVGMDNFPFFSKHYRKKKEKYVERIKDVTIIAVSQWVNEEIKRTYLRNRKSCVITNAIDTDVFKPVESNYLDKFRVLGNEKIIIGVAAKWSENKGYSQFCKLAGLLGEKYIVVLVGNPPNQEYSLPNNLHVIGSITNRNDLAKAYSCADVFVHLSTEETFGLVIAEAACCGKRVVGYDSTGISEVVKRAKGVLIPKDEIEKVALNIANICNNSDKLSDEELNRVRKDFSLAKMKNNHIEIYRNVLLNHKRGY